MMKEIKLGYGKIGAVIFTDSDTVNIGFYELKEPKPIGSNDYDDDKPKNISELLARDGHIFSFRNIESLNATIDNFVDMRKYFNEERL